MSFPISIFLYIYFAFLLFWLIFSLVGVYHMLKFGFRTVTTLTSTLAYILVSIFILFASFIYISQVDWQTEISILPWVTFGGEKQAIINQ